MNKPNPIKKVIIILIFLVIAVGVYFGVTFYNASKKASDIKVTDPKTGKTSFQQRTGSSTDENSQIGFYVDDRTPIKQDNSSSTNNLLVKQRLIQLWKEPVSGFDFITKDIEITSTTTLSTSTKPLSIDEKKTPEQPIISYKKSILKNQEFIYFWDRASGHIYENLSSSTDVFKLSNFTLPRMEEVFFFNKDTVLARGVSSDNETIYSRLLKLYKETATSTVFTANVSNVSFRTKHVAVLPSLNKVFHIIDKTGRGFISNPDGAQQSQVLSTSLTEWLYQYVNKDIVALTTKPSAYFPGYLFLLNTNGKGDNEYIIGEKYGFNTLVSPDGTKVIYNEILNDQLETTVYNIKTKKAVRLTQSTIVEKCTWNKESTLIYCAIPQKLANAPYPDDWYQNKTDFSDNVWSIKPETGDFDVIIPLQDQVSVPIDVLSIKVSDTNKYLLFQDKKTLSLWKYEL